MLALAVVVPIVLGGGSPRPAPEATTDAAPEPPELPRGGRTVFPDYRVIAFYGAPQDDELGALGIGTPDQAAERLMKQAKPYRRGGRKLMPAMELIAVVAATASYEGRYSFRQPRRVIRRYLEAARRADAMLLLDIQPGRADFMEEARYLEEFLREPDVGLALDPEWHVGDGELPGQVIGSVEAEKVNEVADWLSGIVREGNLPEKLLVVHQFTEDMVANRSLLREPPGVALTLNVDGFGTVPLKLAKYRDFSELPPPAHRGFKLFYREDPVVMKPGRVLRMKPQRVFVVFVSRALLDRERALHAGLAVARHGAVERVLAGLELGLDLRGAALLHDLALFVHAVALERDIVRRLGGVLQRDADQPRGGLQLGLVERQLPALVHAELERLPHVAGGRVLTLGARLLAALRGGVRRGRATLVGGLAALLAGLLLGARQAVALGPFLAGRRDRAADGAHDEDRRDGDHERLKHPRAGEVLAHHAERGDHDGPDREDSPDHVKGRYLGPRGDEQHGGQSTTPVGRRALRLPVVKNTPRSGKRGSGEPFRTTFARAARACSERRTPCPM